MDLQTNFLFSQRPITKKIAAKRKIYMTNKPRMEHYHIISRMAIAIAIAIASSKPPRSRGRQLYRLLNKYIDADCSNQLSLSRCWISNQPRSITAYCTNQQYSYQCQIFIFSDFISLHTLLI